MKIMKAVIIGATGATGIELVNNLLERTWISEVKVLVRSPKLKEHQKLKQVVVDFNQLEKYEDEIKGDLAFSCLGTTLKDAGSKKNQWVIDHDYQCRFAQIAKDNDIPIFVLLSAIGANSNSFIFYNKMKGQVENDIKALDFNRLIIVRPSLLIRKGMERKNEKLGRNFIHAMNSIGLMKSKRPLDVKVVANAMAESVDSTVDRFKVVEVDDIIELNKL